MVKILAFLFFLSFCRLQGLNPYYVDEDSIVYGDYVWTMNINKQHEPSFQPNNPEIINATVCFEVLDKRVLHFKLSDKLKRRWEVPILNPKHGTDYKKALIRSMGLIFSNSPFGFEIFDPLSDEIFVSAMEYDNCSLNFTDKFIEYGLWFPAKSIFGLGERVTPDFKLCDSSEKCTYTTFSKDAQSPLDDGSHPGGKNMYGHQPFYLVHLLGNDLLGDKFLGVLFMNSNAQDVVIERSYGGINVHHKTIGGVVDFYFFYPGTAEDVLRKYHSFVGKPYLPPFWALGYHQSRYGWKDLETVRKVVEKFDEEDIPLDAIWADVDYMDNYTDFTVDPVRYKGLSAFVAELHTKSMHWVPIIVPGLRRNLTDAYYKSWVSHKALIHSARTKQELVGKGLADLVAFPDWMHPEAAKLWREGLSSLYAKAEFDGIWLDMNEVTNLCDGEIVVKKAASDPHDPTEFDQLPYTPGNVNLSKKAISLTGYHNAAKPENEELFKEFNLHSLWSIYEAKATHEYFEEAKKRPFVLTRANFVGSGMFASKLLGDNFSKWEYLRYSITGLYNFQMFGMPLAGADVCGFLGDADEELCMRWMQLGAFYPLTRNHNDANAKDQEPYRWPKVARASRNAIRQKYSILRYYYTKLFEVSANGGSVIRPLFFECPKDAKAHGKRNETFMIGPALMVAPVLTPKTSIVSPYFTNEDWFDLFSKKKIMEYYKPAKEGAIINITTGDYVSVFLKGGNIVPFQDATKAKIRRLATLQYLPMEIVVAPDHNGIAKGNFIVDSQSSVNPLATKEYVNVEMEFVKKNLTLIVKSQGAYKEKHNFERFSRVTILGAKSFADVKTACLKSELGKGQNLTGEYDAQREVLSFYKPLDLYWWEISNITFNQLC